MLLSPSSLPTSAVPTSGERDLLEEATGGETFSKQGRVEWSLARRGVLLAQVARLAVALGVPGDVGYTCETAAYFHRQHVMPRIDSFRRLVKTATTTAAASSSSSANKNKNKSGSGQTTATSTTSSPSSSVVAESFPFTAYFADAPTPLFAPSSSSSSSSPSSSSSLSRTTGSSGGSDGDDSQTALARDLEAAEGGLAHINRLFDELADYR